MPALPEWSEAPDLKGERAKLFYDLADAPVPELLSALLQIVSPNHLLYGSDWPFTPTKACAALAQKLARQSLKHTVT